MPPSAGPSSAVSVCLRPRGARSRARPRRAARHENEIACRPSRKATRGSKMPVYISLLRFTQQGVEAVKDQGSRIDRLKEAYRAAGGELIAYYATMGRYDGVAVYRMRDDAAAATFCLAAMAKGNV